MGAFFRAESTLLPQYILKCIITAMMQQQSATNNTKQHEKRTTQKRPALEFGSAWRSNRRRPGDYLG
jgi:hypothetical protein